MGKTLIVSSNPAAINNISLIIEEAALSEILSADCESNALATVKKYPDIELCIINSPLEKDSAVDLAEFLSLNTQSEVILLWRYDELDIVNEQMSELGVFCVSKPIKKALFINTIKLSKAAHRRHLRIEQEKQELIKKYDDLKLAERAKLVLISTLNMTEKEAHRYIEKHAMDTRKTKAEIAQHIISTYDASTDRRFRRHL